MFSDSKIAQRREGIYPQTVVKARGPNPSDGLKLVQIYIRLEQARKVTDKAFFAAAQMFTASGATSWYHY
jgi:hypothetical protein